MILKTNNRSSNLKEVQKMRYSVEEARAITKAKKDKAKRALYSSLRRKTDELADHLSMQKDTNVVFKDTGVVASHSTGSSIIEVRTLNRNRLPLFGTSKVNYKMQLFFLNDLKKIVEGVEKNNSEKKAL